ncbi:adrenoceptor alpha 1Bb [Clarias gariepinus]|uniref:adrenoceptor alpha 1Bb n=1 Tax=Clarias gariepinus TaxID=13013 RepID=UPI00234D6083|nr:adrenoceptor alpha 1Bb [Clarias gariepinus]
MTPENDSCALLNGSAGCPASGARHPPVQLSRALPLGLVLGALIVFAALGNALVVASVLRDRRLRAPTHWLIANLAAADLLLSAAVLPVSAAHEVLQRWAFGSVFCDVWAALDVLCCTASILSLCVISVDRYVGVSRPLAYSRIVTRRRAALAALSVWLASVLISVGPLLGWKQARSPDAAACDITEEPYYALFSSLASFYIPLAVILAMYCRVYIVAKRTSLSLQLGVRKERINSTEVTLRIHQGSRTREEPGHHPRSAHSITALKFSREKKAAKTVGVLVGAFTACWLPFFITLPIVSFNTHLRPPESVFKFVFWLGYFNSCVNPVIYPCYSREFRRAFARILRCRRRRSLWRTFPPHSASSCQTRKDSRDSMENYSSFEYGSQRMLSFSSPCLSPGFHSKSQFTFSEHGHFHARSRNNSVLVENFTDRPLEPVREDTALDNGQLNPINAETFSESDAKDNQSIGGEHHCS